MTNIEAQRTEDKYLAERLALLEFNRVAELLYERLFGEAIGRLAFSCRPDPRGFFGISCNVGIRFPRLDPLLRGGVTLQLEEHVVVVTMPLHLIANTTFKEWAFRDEAEMERVSLDIEAQVRKSGVPFLRRYSELSAVRARLESELPADWFVLTPEGRLVLLAAMTYVDGETRRGLEILERALKERSDEPPKKRRQLEELRRRLLDGLR